MDGIVTRFSRAVAVEAGISGSMVSVAVMKRSIIVTMKMVREAAAVVTIMKMVMTMVIAMVIERVRVTVMIAVLSVLVAAMVIIMTVRAIMMRASRWAVRRSPVLISLTFVAIFRSTPMGVTHVPFPCTLLMPVGAMVRRRVMSTSTGIAVSWAKLEARPSRGRMSPTATTVSVSLMMLVVPIALNSDTNQDDLVIVRVAIGRDVSLVRYDSVQVIPKGFIIDVKIVEIGQARILMCGGGSWLFAEGFGSPKCLYVGRGQIFFVSRHS